MARGSTVATPGGMAECLTPLVSPVSTPVVTLPPTVFRRNYGPGRTMFDYSDTIRHTGGRGGVMGREREREIERGGGK